jgi:septum site-determining protein MinC
MNDSVATVATPPLEQTQSCFQLKGSMFSLPVMHIKTDDISALAQELTQAVKASPSFFLNMPMVLDLSYCKQHSIRPNFGQLTAALAENRIIPIGVRGGSSALNHAATAAGLAIMPTANKSEASPVEAANTPAPTPAESSPPSTTQTASLLTTKVIKKPVRSGQKIYAQQANLVLFAPVSHGAEVIADGDIHIYGALRGRALAGANNNSQANIFCQQLDAELLAVAGSYLTKEDLKKFPPPAPEQLTHIYLQEGRIQLEYI